MEVILVLILREIKLILRKWTLLGMFLLLPVVIAGIVLVSTDSEDAADRAVFLMLPVSAVMMTFGAHKTCRRAVLQAFASLPSINNSRLTAWSLALLVVLIAQAAIYNVLIKLSHPYWQPSWLIEGVIVLASIVLAQTLHIAFKPPVRNSSEWI